METLFNERHNKFETMQKFNERNNSPYTGITHRCMLLQQKLKTHTCNLCSLNNFHLIILLLNIKINEFIMYLDYKNAMHDIHNCFLDKIIVFFLFLTLLIIYDLKYCNLDLFLQPKRSKFIHLQIFFTRGLIFMISKTLYKALNDGNNSNDKMVIKMLFNWL